MPPQTKTASSQLPNLFAPPFAKTMFAGDAPGVPKPPVMQSARGSTQNAPKVKEVDASIKEPSQMKKQGEMDKEAIKALLEKLLRSGRHAEAAFLEGVRTEGGAQWHGLLNKVMNRAGGAYRGAKDTATVASEGYAGGRAGFVAGPDVSDAMHFGNRAGHAVRGTEKAWDYGRKGEKLPSSAGRYHKAVNWTGRNPGKAAAGAGVGLLGGGYLLAGDGEEKAASVDERSAIQKQGEMDKEALRGFVLKALNAIGDVSGGLREGYEATARGIDPSSLPKGLRPSPSRQSAREAGSTIKGRVQDLKDRLYVMREGYEGGRAGFAAGPDISDAMRAGNRAGHAVRGTEKAWDYGMRGEKLPSSAGRYHKSVNWAGRHPVGAAAVAGGGLSGAAYLLIGDGEEKAASVNEKRNLKKEAMGAVLKGLLGTSALGGAAGLGYLVGKERYDETGVISESLPGGQWALSAMSLPHQKRVRRLLETGKQDEAAQLYADLLTSGEAIRTASNASALRKSASPGILRLFDKSAAGPGASQAVTVPRSKNPWNAPLRPRAMLPGAGQLPASTASAAVVADGQVPAQQPTSGPAAAAAMSAPPAPPAAQPPPADSAAGGQPEGARLPLAPNKGGTGGDNTAPIAERAAMPPAPDPAAAGYARENSAVAKWLTRAARNEQQRQPAPSFFSQHQAPAR